VLPIEAAIDKEVTDLVKEDLLNDERHTSASFESASPITMHQPSAKGKAPA
jgi:hypothetical protein